MSKYKVGDRVLVVATIGLIDEAGWIRCDTKPGASMDYVWVKETSIHGPAPAPEVDWSKVEMGARVRVRDEDSDHWVEGRYIQHVGGGYFQALTLGGDTAYWVQCELLEEE